MDRLFPKYIVKKFKQVLLNISKTNFSDNYIQSSQVESPQDEVI